MRLLSKIQKNIILLLLTSISFVLLTFYMNDRSKSELPFIERISITSDTRLTQRHQHIQRAFSRQNGILR